MPTFATTGVLYGGWAGGLEFSLCKSCLVWGILSGTMMVGWVGGYCALWLTWVFGKGFGPLVVVEGLWCVNGEFQKR